MSATGIRARTTLPSTTYDHLFTLVEDAHLGALCVMVPGCAGFDPDYWEEVPAPGDKESRHGTQES
jgi:hypothetical protein